MLRVAVIGGGPSGSCAAEILAKSGIKTWLFERKLDNAKPCGGAIPLCMVEEFDLPESIIDSGKSNSSTMQRGIAPPHGFALSNFLSNSQVFIPALASISAAHEPLGPPPITATLNI